MALIVGAGVPNLPRWLTEASKQAMGNDPGLDVWMQAMATIGSHRTLAHVAQLWITLCERQPKEDLRIDDLDLHLQEVVPVEPQELAISSKLMKPPGIGEFRSVTPTDPPQHVPLHSSWLEMPCADTSMGEDGIVNVASARSVSDGKKKKRLSKFPGQEDHVLNQPYQRKSGKHLYAEEGPFARIARSQFFEMGSLGIIIVNFFWIGIDIEFNKEDNLRNAKPIFIVVEVGFLIIFSLELAVRFLAFRRWRSCIEDGWFVFDSVLVTMMVIETIFLPFILKADDLGPVGLLRILRLLRLTRMVRLVRALPELLVFLKSMISASRSVCTTGILIIILIYCFSIFFVELCGMSTWCRNAEECAQELYPLRVYFADLPTAMITLFVQGTLLDEVSQVVLDLKASSGILLLIFISFVCISAFTVLNMLIGVLCDQIVVTSDLEKRKILFQKIHNTLTKVYSQMDSDSDGVITEEEFMAMQFLPDVQTSLAELGVEPQHLLALQDAIFNDEKEIRFEKFFELLCRLRPGEKASVLDVAELRMLVRHSSEKLEEMLGRLHQVVMQGISRPDQKRLGPALDSHNPRWFGPKDAAKSPSNQSKTTKVSGDIEVHVYDAALPGVPAHR